MKILNSEKLMLREWRESDSVDLYEYAKSDLVGPNAGWKPHKSEKESKEIIKIFIESNDTYAIVLKSENKVIGSIGLHNRKPEEEFCDLDQREIGYVLNPKYWGNGYALEAVNSLLDYAYNELNIDLVWCCHFEKNYKSKRVIEKCGFRYKFTKFKTLKLLDNKDVKSLCYALSKSEYLNE